jgi:peptidoglycan/LPS O-acetylase OafA/YrhL
MIVSLGLVTMDDHLLRILIAIVAGSGGAVFVLAAAWLQSRRRSRPIARAIFWPTAVLGLTLVLSAVSVFPSTGTAGRAAGFGAAVAALVGILLWFRAIPTILDVYQNRHAR